MLGPDVIQSRFSRLHLKDEERAAELARIFAQAGCAPPNYFEEKIQSSTLPNLICTLPGSSKYSIVVTAHYDKRGPGEGAIDDWSGASLLPALYESLRGAARRLTFQFIAFTDEEKGLIGSRDHVQHLSYDQRSLILLDVNIDCIGLEGPIRIWADRADDSLMTAAAITADRTKVGLGGISMGERYDSDASAFSLWRIPVIDFHALTRDRLRLLHSKRDVRGALDEKSYYDHYRFLAAFLAYLDETLPTPGQRSTR
jgi:hypothetical protein